jgi:hypothetical protein
MAIENLNMHMNLGFINFIMAYFGYIQAAKKNKAGLESPPHSDSIPKSSRQLESPSAHSTSFFALHYGESSPICFQRIELETIDS